MQIPAPHQAEDGTKSELYIFCVGALPARQGYVLSKASLDKVVSWNCRPPRNV